MRDTPADRREQTGDGENTPPELERSGSEGDRNKNSLGPSPWPRRTVRYVANYDGTTIAERTEALLVEILAELRKLNER